MPKNSSIGHGTSIVDRYMPHATQAEREKAQESLNDFAKLIIRILERITREEVGNAIRQDDVRELDSDSSLHHER